MQAIKALLVMAYLIFWVVLGAHLESTGIKSPPFYAVYGAAGIMLLQKLLDWTLK